MKGQVSTGAAVFEDRELLVGDRQSQVLLEWLIMIDDRLIDVSETEPVTGPADRHLSPDEQRNPYRQRSAGVELHRKPQPVQPDATLDHDRDLKINDEFRIVDLVRSLCLAEL